MRALLVIDMQVGCFSASPRYDADATVERINRLLGRFHQDGVPVIFIQHDGSQEDWLRPGSPEFAVLPGLDKREGDPVVVKTANDAFYHTRLDALLKDLGVDTLVITGCATDFCVNATVHGALTRDYGLIIPKDCHTTGDRPGLSAVELIQFHNWLWANLTPTASSIRVCELKEILQ